MRRLALLTLAVAVAACDVSGPEPNLSFERMLVQPKKDPYEGSSVFADGMTMRHPPAGTVPRERRLGPEPVLAGTREGEPVAAVPIAVGEALLARGRERFAITCAACHGVAGDGESPVAEAMTLRKPPSLVDPPVAGQTAGHLFAVATHGFGLMPGYGDVLSVEDRWAVVAYVEALQIARRTPLESLPGPLRERARAALDRQEPSAPEPQPAERPVGEKP